MEYINPCTVFKEIVPIAFNEDSNHIFEPEDDCRMYVIMTTDRKNADIIIKDTEFGSDIVWRGFVSCKPIYHNEFIIIDDYVFKNNNNIDLIHLDCDKDDWNEFDISLQLIMKTLFSSNAFHMNHPKQKRFVNIFNEYTPMREVKNEGSKIIDTMISNGIIDYIINNISTLTTNSMSELESLYKLFCPSKYIQEYILDFVKEDFKDISNALQAAVDGIPDYRICWLDMLSASLSGSINEAKNTENSIIIKLHINKHVESMDVLRFEDTFIAIGMEICKEYAIYHNKEHHKFIVPLKMMENSRNLIIVPDDSRSYNNLEMQFMYC